MYILEPRSEFSDVIFSQHLEHMQLQTSLDRFIMALNNGSRRNRHFGDPGTFSAEIRVSEGSVCCHPIWIGEGALFDRSTQSINGTCQRVSPLGKYSNLREARFFSDSDTEGPTRRLEDRNTAKESSRRVRTAAGFETVQPAKPLIPAKNASFLRPPEAPI